MKFKERLWQLFLAIVLGVTLSVCDAGSQDDELESSALIAGSAIAAGVTSGDGYVKIGDLIINYGSLSNSYSIQTINFKKSYQTLPLMTVIKCINPTEGNVTEIRPRSLSSSTFSFEGNQNSCALTYYPTVSWIAFGS